MDSAPFMTGALSGYLYRGLPRVYAVGHRAKSVEADLAAALLYAGPGAMLSHATAAWWVGLALSKPYMIDVSTPRRCRSITGIRVHARRPLDRDWHKTPPRYQFTQTMIDYATVSTLSKVRLALARRGLRWRAQPRAIEARWAGDSRVAPSSARPSNATSRCSPEPRSGLGIQLFELCESARLPLPELNARVAGWDVDALWR